jgi:hypothetical protein
MYGRGGLRSLLVCVSLAGPTLEVALGGENRLFIADDTYFVVWTVNADSGEVLRGFPLPAEAMGNILPRGESGLAFDGTDLFYTRSCSRHVWVLDPVSGSLRRTIVKPSMAITGLASGPGGLFGVSSTQIPGSLVAFDPLTGDLLGPRRHIPGALRAIAFNADAGSIYLRIGALEVRELSPAGETLRSFPPPAPLAALCHGSATLFALSEAGVVYRLDPASGNPLASFVPAGRGSPQGIRGSSIAVGAVSTNPGDGTGSLEGGDIPDARLKIQDSTIVAGKTAAVPILLSSTAETHGFTIAAIHDPVLLSLETISFDDTVTGYGDPELLFTTLHPNGGTVSVAFNVLIQHDVAIPPGENMIIARYGYRCVDPELQSPITTEVRFADGVLGSPPLDNLLVFNDLSYAPDLLSGKIACRPRSENPGGPEFFCGGPLGPDGVPSIPAARSGERVTLDFFYAFGEPQGAVLQGLSMALEHDCRLTVLEHTFRVPEESITAAVDADFVEFQADGDGDDGDGCEMVLAILVDSEPPFNAASLPATYKPLLLASVDMEIGGGVQVGECLEIRFRDGVNGQGKIPIRNLFSLDNQSVEVTTYSSSVCVTATGPSFYCGSATLAENGRPEPSAGLPGEEVDVCFWYSSPGEDVLALTQALRFDCRLECLEGTFAISPEASAFLNAGMVRFQCESDPADGDGCEMVLEITPGPDDPPSTVILPPANRPMQLGCARVRIRQDAPRGPCLPLEYLDGIDGRGETPTSNTVTLHGGPVSPHTFDGQVCVLAAESSKFFGGGPSLGSDGRPERITEVPAGERAPFCFWYSSPEDEFTGPVGVQGMSMALCYDCRLTAIETSFRVPPDSITAAIEAEYVQFHVDNDPGDGDGCEMILGILVDADPPFDGRTLPNTEEPLKLACVDMEVNPTTELGTCLEIDFCDGANGDGKVPINNLVSIQSQSQQVETFGSAICVSHLGPCFFCGGSVLDPSGNLPVDATGAPGEPAELCLWYNAPEKITSVYGPFHHIQGLSMALTFDCRNEAIESSVRIPPDSILAIMDAEYVSLQADNDPADGDGCEILLGVLIDANPPFDGRTLPPTEVPLKLVCVDLLLPSDAVCNDCFPVNFQDGLNGRGKVPIRNLVSVDNYSFLACTVDCKVCVTETEQLTFIRGDCNFDGRVDIADAAHIISSLFAADMYRPLPVCLDACDANDDGRLDLADAITVLRYLFQRGKIPPQPGPLTPGFDPTEDLLDCGSHPCS